MLTAFRRWLRYHRTLTRLADQAERGGYETSNEEWRALEAQARGIAGSPPAPR
jgi:hypothetical protein